MYGSYSFWAWLKYWYIDTANQVAMMLIDKQYYDYDFEPIKAKKRILYEDTVRNETETRNILSMFGIGTKKEESIEDLQKLAMKEMEENSNKK